MGLIEIGRIKTEGEEMFLEINKEYKSGLKIIWRVRKLWLGARIYIKIIIRLQYQNTKADIAVLLLN